MECPKCQFVNQPAAKFCRRCGERLPQSVAPPAAPPVVQPAVPPASVAPGSQVACFRCGNPLRPGARFCAKCGTPQPSASQPPVPQPVMPPAATPPPPTSLSAGQPPVYQPPAPPPVPVQPVLPLPAAPVVKPPRPPLRLSGYVLRHAVILGALCAGLVLALGAALAYDRGQRVATPAPPPEITPPAVAPAPLPTADYRLAVVEIGSDGRGQFGLISTTGDPASTQDNRKKLTYSPIGDTNNTRIWIDGETPVYGTGSFLGLGGGRFTEEPHLVDGALRSVWRAGDVEAALTVSYANGSNTRRVDTAKIQYVLTNRGGRSYDVGLRIMLDTLIGDNDGVPFVVPGRSGITDRAVRLRGASVPDFMQALEYADLVNPGVIVNMTLRGADATPPDEVVISAWCSEDVAWDYYALLGGDGHPLDRCGRAGDTPDSAIGLYYAARPLGPGEGREIVAYYGLGGISSTASRNARLGLTFNRNVRQGDTFWVTALVTAPRSGQTIRLELPSGLSFAAGHSAEQAVRPDGDYTQVSWQVVADQPLNDAKIIARLQPDDIQESQSITVQPRGLTR